jgi:hypothetical protein
VCQGHLFQLYTEPGTIPSRLSRKSSISLGAPPSSSIDTSQLQRQEPTHVVTRIVWGLVKAKEDLFQLPDYINSPNNRSGVQIAYSLLPIGFVSLNFGISPTIAVGQPSPERLTGLVSLLDEAEDAAQSLNDYYAFLKQNDLFVSLDHLMKVGNEIRYASLQKTTLVNQYTHCLKAIR